jgi:hypothetical protein
MEASPGANLLNLLSALRKSGRSVLQIFLQKHASSKGERLVSGNSMFFRMHRILDIFFVGGFGTVCDCFPHAETGFTPFDPSSRGKPVLTSVWSVVSTSSVP